ncbi:MAG: radical SAM protein [Verrucomicrobiota bacterium]
MREAPPLPDCSNTGPMVKRYVRLVQPFYPKDPHASYGKHVLTPSLALTSLAAATPEHWRVDWWDENLLHGPPPMEPLPEVVGITVHLTFAERACQLAAWYRQHGVKVILGGLHAMACPEELMRYADAIVIGDGVRAWPQVLADVERQTLQPCYRCEFDGDYGQEPAPRRQLISPHSFLTRASLMATRGCHNRCEFCFLSTGNLRMPCRERPPEDIARQLAESGEPYAAFLDNNLGAKRGYLRQLCRELKPLGKIWSAAISLDVSDDHALVREMSLAGCTGVFVGFESLSDENLIGARKRTPRVADYARRIQIFHDQGIQVNGSFVLGFDGDRKDVFQTTAQWIEQNRLECATFHILTPYPGTPLFRQMETSGRLRHRNWNLYDTAHAVFYPKHMTPEELELGYDWLYRRLFSPASIWRRRPRHASAIAPYLAMSLLYKRSNRLWHFLIKHDLVHAVWSPLVHWSRRRHLAFRRRLEAQPVHLPVANPAPAVISAGV